MNPTIFMAVVFGSVAIFSASAEDMLRSVNGDQLHGKYHGIGKDGYLKWQREDVGDAVGFKTDKLRHVVLAGGNARPLRSISHIGLVNGDRCPVRSSQLMLMMLSSTRFMQVRSVCHVMRWPCWRQHL